MAFFLVDVFNRCRLMLTRGFWPILAVSLVVATGLTMVVLLFESVALRLNFPPILAFLLLGVVGVILSSQMAVVTHIALRVARGRLAGLGMTLRSAVDDTVSVFFVMVLFALGWAAGLLLVVVPGLVFATVCCVAVPACVGDRTGVVGAFRRSEALTKGYRWVIFGMWFVAFVVDSLFWRAIKYVDSGTDPMAGSGLGEGAVGSVLSGVVPLLVEVLAATIVLAAATLLNAALFLTLKAAAGEGDYRKIEEIFE